MPDDAPSLYVAEARPAGGVEAADAPSVETEWPPALYVPGAGVPTPGGQEASDEGEGGAPNLEAVATEAVEAEGAEAGEEAPPSGEEPGPLRRLREALEADPQFPSAARYAHELEPALEDPEMLQWISGELADEADERGCDHLCAAEPVGTLLGAVAGRSGLPLVPVRRGATPGEGGSGEVDPLDPAGLELREGALEEGDRVLLLDERLADGRVLARAAELVEAAGAEIGGIATVLEVRAQGGRERLERYPVTSLLAL